MRIVSAREILEAECLNCGARAGEMCVRPHGSGSHEERMWLRQGHDPDEFPDLRERRRNGSRRGSVTSRAEMVLRDAGMLGTAGGHVTEIDAVQPAQPVTVSDFAEIDSVIMGAPPAAQFKDPGAVVVGEITRVILRQATDFTSKEPKWWPDGSPLLEPVITLETAEGPVSVYAGSKGMRDALREACREAGAGLRPGGRLAVKYTGDGVPFKAGVNAPKLYAAGYDPPAGMVPARTAVPAGGQRTEQLVAEPAPPF